MATTIAVGRPDHLPRDLESQVDRLVRAGTDHVRRPSRRRGDRPRGRLRSRAPRSRRDRSPAAAYRSRRRHGDRRSSDHCGGDRLVRRHPAGARRGPPRGEGRRGGAAAGRRTPRGVRRRRHQRRPRPGARRCRHRRGVPAPTSPSRRPTSRCWAAAWTGVADAVDLARRTYRVIAQNLFWAFAYNVVMIPLAVVGLLTPDVGRGRDGRVERERRRERAAASTVPPIVPYAGGRMSVTTPNVVEVTDADFEQLVIEGSKTAAGGRRPLGRLVRPLPDAGSDPGEGGRRASRVRSCSRSSTWTPTRSATPCSKP